MLVLEGITDSKQCEVDIDYYVPFTIRLKPEKLYAPKVCWRIGNFENSLMEITIDESTGMLQEITLTSVNRAHLVNTTLEDTKIAKNGTPVFRLEGTVKNGLCNKERDFDVYLSMKFIMVDFSEGECPIKFIELGRVCFGFDKDSKLISVTIRNLSADEYDELKDGLKL